MLSNFLNSLTATGGLLRVRAVITLSLTGAIVYLFISGDAVPDQLMQAWFGVGGLYFGSRIAATNGS